MSNISEFFENFSLKSRHHSKLINFLLPELKKNNNKLNKKIKIKSRKNSFKNIIRKFSKN